MLVIAGCNRNSSNDNVGLLPQLAGTFCQSGKEYSGVYPAGAEWADHWFHNNKEIMNVVNNLEFDWNKIMEAAAGFLKNGAGSVLETTINTAKNIIGAVGTFLLHLYSQFIFCCRKRNWEDRRKSIICVCQEGESRSCIGSAGSDV